MSGPTPWNAGDRHPEKPQPPDTTDEQTHAMHHAADDAADHGTTSTEEVDDMHTLVGAYALDALDAGERAEFEAHLATCDDCRAATAEFTDTAALLAEAASTPAPASLRAAVLRAVATTPQEGPGEAPRDAPRRDVAGARLPAPADADQGSAHRADAPAPVSLEERRARRRPTPLRAPRWPLALAAACTAVALTATGWGWTQAQQAERAQLQAIDADRHAQRMAELLTAPGSRVQNVTGREGASAAVVHTGTEAVVIGAGLPEVRPGRGYQLWLIDGGRIRPAGMLERDRAGHYTAYVADTGGVPTLGVTEEPAAGSEQPTTEPVLAADISAA